MQEVFFYFDDSGVLHKNEKSGYFVYAGYVFAGKKELEDARHKYICANKKLREATGLEGELKASKLNVSQKRSLFNSVREYDSVSVSVKLSEVPDYIMGKKKSICRYKDFILKKCVIGKLQKLLDRNVLKIDEEITVNISIDQQLTGIESYYDFRDSIQEELEHGIVNWNYGIIHESVFKAPVKVKLRYCDSAKDYLIQASDILANRIWSSYWGKNEKLRKISNHYILTFPED